MQTLKTAAIVVLLMTIIYGAYVSLTTPPEPLPPEVEGMLVMSEEGDFSIDSGLPESLGALTLDAGAGQSTATAGQTLEYPAGNTAGTLSNTFAPGSAAAGANDLAVIGTLSDGSATLSGENYASDENISATAANPRADLQSSYPSTGQTFSMPSPKSLDVKFQTASSVTPSFSGGTPELTIDPVSPAAAVDPAGSADPTDNSQIGIANAIRTADKQFSEDKLKDALATLSLFYNTPNLTGEQRTDLLSRLDPLAREVIYSRRHLLEQAHRVGQNETLMQVAERYEVPWQLLANINQVKDPVTVLPGTELKVVRGPFRAEVDLVQKELTLFLDDLYAGRFPIGVGNDPPPKPGTYTIQDKQNAHTYYDASGAPIPPGSPSNPYGNVWLDLGGQLCIHGSPSTTTPSERGCISLSADYADDLYGILTQGSSVTIRR